MSEKELYFFLEKTRALGSVPGLVNMENLMNELGNAQEELAVIHVAGTNGKGSVCAMLEQILCMSGYRTGRYSSPAVFCEEERYQINGVYINKETYHAILSEIAEACERLTERRMPHPTLFEIETALAFLWFYRENCQVVILETGMGGALDATNIIKKPLLSVITSISMDHMAFLGTTLSEITAQKAGIIKEGCPVVTARQEPEVYEVLKKVCREKHTDLVVADGRNGERAAEAEPAGGIRNLRYADGYLVFDWEEFADLQLSLLGAYQPENAVCAIQAIHRLNGLEFCIGDDTIRAALRNTVWPGRFEVISRSPFIVIDGAHNAGAAKKLRETLKLGFTNRKIIYIIGMFQDKEHEKVLAELLPLAEKVYTVTPPGPRGLPGEILCAEAEKWRDEVRCAEAEKCRAEVQCAEVEKCRTEVQCTEAGKCRTEVQCTDAEKCRTQIQCADSVREALEKAMLDAELMTAEGQLDKPMILAFGSLSYLGELKSELNRIKTE